MFKNCKTWECTENCRSELHASLLTNAVASVCDRTDAQIASFLVETCRNFARIADFLGRTVLHIAASTGRKNLVEWLVTKAGANINARDTESGYTALQRSIYYGHLDVAVKLVQLGCDFTILDYENLSAVSFLKNETHLLTPPSPHQNTQLYVFGQNQNYTLGTGTDDAKRHPELSEHFRKNAVSIKKVYLEEFHSVFIDSKKRVWVCGSGRGGRLGVGNEKSILIPQLLNLSDECESAAVSLNHTLLLLSNGSVLAFGINTYHQLGVTPYIEFIHKPRHVNLNQAIRLFGRMEGVLTSKYHSVFYNNKAIFFCGKHESDQRTDPSNLITVPVQITSLKPNDVISHVASCENYLAYTIQSGDVFIFNRLTFNTKKVLSKQAKIVQILIGTDPSHSDEVRMILLDSNGILNFWQGHLWQHTLKCTYNIRRSFFVTNIFLNDERILFVSKTGEAFTGAFRVRDRVFLRRDIANAKVVEPTISIEVTVNEVPNVHRATSIFSDPKGRNFAIIQEHPLNNLILVPEIEKNVFVDQFRRFLSESSPSDELHDIVLNVKGKQFAAHRYILESRGCHLTKSDFENVHPEYVAECLTYFYTGTCELTQSGLCLDRFSNIASNPLKEFETTLKKLGVTEPTETLNLSFKNGFITSTKPVGTSLKFDRTQFLDLSDVDLLTDDGHVIKAHKCILSARVDYFNSMFTGGWSESKKRQTLKLPCNLRIANYLLDFIYHGEMNDTFGPEDVKIVSRLLILADQFLINDMKVLCESLLVELLDLRNCADILQLAATFNGSEIKESVMEFIALNIDALLESRHLECLDEQQLLEFARYFRAKHEFVYAKRDFSSQFNDYERINVLNDSMTDFPVIEGPNISSPTPQPSHKKKSKKHSPSSILSVADEITLDRKSMVKQVSPICASVLSDLGRRVDSSPKVPECEREEDLFNAFDFPVLSSSPPSLAKSSPPKSGTPRKPFLPLTKKLSQKQKKKLSQESIEIPSSPQKPTQVKSWAIIEPPLVTHDVGSPHAASEIHFQQSNSPGNRISPGVNFSDIVANEEQKRSNWIKMKSKPFHLTQFEDKAITDLFHFYNVDNVFDERITVRRVIQTNIAQPTWIPSHR